MNYMMTIKLLQICW